MLKISFVADPLIILSDALWDRKGGNNYSNLHPFLSQNASENDDHWINNKA